jgi:hypothetical protein
MPPTPRGSPIFPRLPGPTFTKSLFRDCLTPIREVVPVHRKVVAVAASLFVVGAVAFAIAPWASSETPDEDIEWTTDFPLGLHGWGPGPGWGARNWGLRACHLGFRDRRNDFLEALADELGIEVEDLEDAIESVKEEFRADARERFRERLDQAVEEGRLSQREANRIRRMWSSRRDLDMCR